MLEAQLDGRAANVAVYAEGHIHPRALLTDPAMTYPAVGFHHGVPTGLLQSYAPGTTTPFRHHEGLPEFFSFALAHDGTSLWIAPGSGQTVTRVTYPDLLPIYALTDRHARFGFAGVAALPAARPGTWYR